jgi:hypothetical protein
MTAVTRRLIIYRIALACGLLALSVSVPCFTSRFYGAHDSGRFLYGLVFPSLPFVVLCLFTLAKTEGRFVFSLSGVLGATVGAVGAIAFAWVPLWYASANYRGGGANFGLGFLWLFLPVYLPVAMFVGGWFGRALYLYFWEWKRS